LIAGYRGRGEDWVDLPEGDHGITIIETGRCTVYLCDRRRCGLVAHDIKGNHCAIAAKACCIGNSQCATRARGAKSSLDCCSGIERTVSWAYYLKRIARLGDNDHVLHCICFIRGRSTVAVTSVWVEDGAVHGCIAYRGKVDDYPSA